MREPRPAPCRLVAARVAVLAVFAVASVYGGARAEDLTERTPNFLGTAPTDTGTVDFPFVHRFRVDAGFVDNSPTFTATTGVLRRRLAIGARYATASNVAGQANELEAFLHARLFGGDRFAVSVLPGWNFAARSADGAITARTRVGPLDLLATARGFSDGYGDAGPTAAAAGGAVLHLNRNLALVGDAGGIVASRRFERIEQAERVAWSAGVAFRIPYSPHSMSIHAANTLTGTLQGASRGGERVFYGFEFDVPFRSLERWIAIVRPRDAAAADRTPAAEAPIDGPVLEIAIRDFRYHPANPAIAPGTTVRWINHDEVPHTATDRDRAWDSGDIPPGGSWSRRFDDAAEFDYFCTIHPWMEATLAVRPESEGEDEP